MASHVKILKDKGLIQPPKWLPNNIIFEGMTGSIAYNVSNDSSDIDLIGFCMPPKEVLFPHLAGEISGFGTQSPRFEQFQQHHIVSPEKTRTYDITIYNIVKFFQLAMENNPNMVDAVFLPRRCILYSNEIYEIMRENRKLFLHKGCWHKFRGYAYSQIHKMKTGANKANPVRQESIEKFGYDVKFGYHVVRLVLECEQILVEHDLDIERNSEILKSIRRGEWTLLQLEDWFAKKEKSLEEVYHSSTLQYVPDEAAIKSVLMECLEAWYGDNLFQSQVIAIPQDNLLDEMLKLLEKYK